MHTFKAIKYLLFCCIVGKFLSVQSLSYAEESLEESIDCTDVRVEYVDEPGLTREERLRRMDEAFFESLNKFEMCQESKEQEKAETGSGGGSDGSQGIDGEMGDASGGGSVASTSMSGTEEPKEYPSAEGFEMVEPKPLQNGEVTDEKSTREGGDLKQANGKTPDDIPPAKNDDALAAQIRYAAENEPDPEKSRQLWNEYRKYKGLATK